MSEDKEVVLTTYTSYVPSPRVHRFTSVIVLDATRLGARPGAPGQLYRRSDLSLVRADQTARNSPRVQLWRAPTVCSRIRHHAKLYTDQVLSSHVPHTAQMDVWRSGYIILTSMLSASASTAASGSMFIACRPLGRVKT